MRESTRVQTFRRTCVVALLVAQSACEADGDPRCRGLESPPTLQVGGSEWSSGVFIELGDGDEWLVQVGPMGLQVVLVAVRGRGLYPGDVEAGANWPEVELRATADEREIGSSYGGIGFVDADDLVETRAIMIALHDADCGQNEYQLECYVGRDLTLEAQITDVCGNEAAGSLTVSLCNDSSAYPCSN